MALASIITDEGPQAGEFILSEANRELSRENITVASGQVLDAGTVLGKITVGGKYAIHDPAVLDGSGVAAAILFDNVDAALGDKAAVIIDCLAEVKKALLIWKAGMTDNQKATALAALRVNFIKAR